ncbi:hypothetical protein LZ32DRAFT_30684 [Colletotrichum eremochloae]|nr:hypothetical protein LZ32DRAFT_30684 [Colletotrichum eremochloae]
MTFVTFVVQVAAFCCIARHFQVSNKRGLSSFSRALFFLFFFFSLCPVLKGTDMVIGVRVTDPDY